MRDKPPFCWCHDDQIPDDGTLFGEIEDAADEAPQDGETYVSSWGEILYEMTNGEMGTPPPQTLRRYEPKPTPRQTRKKR